MSTAGATLDRRGTLWAGTRSGLDRRGPGSRGVATIHVGTRFAGALGWFAAVASAVFALLGAGLWLFVRLPEPVVDGPPGATVMAGGATAAWKPGALIAGQSDSTDDVMMAADSGRLASALADRYRIERELGAGGMATVYLAEDLKRRRSVALKVLKPELACRKLCLLARRSTQSIAPYVSPGFRAPWA